MKHVLNQYFDRIYVVTVYTFLERHRQVRQQLKGIDFEWIFSPPPEWLSPSVISPSEKSITIGMFQAIANAKFHGYKRIALWEDDGILTATEDEIKKFLDDVPPDWDTLYMGSAVWAEKIWPFTHEEYSEHAYRVLHGNGNSFLGVQSHIYDRMMVGLPKFNAPADFKFNNLFKKRNCFAPKTFFCRPNSGPDPRYINQFTKEEIDSHIPSHIVHSV